MSAPVFFRRRFSPLGSERLFPSAFVALGALLIGAATHVIGPDPARAGDQPAAPAKSTAPRFDAAVRNDFFAGFAGDRTALDRAMTTCEAVLAAKPAHAEALVWHGAGLMLRAGELFRRGDVQKGRQTWERGLAEMDEAVRLEPKMIGVRVPRAAALIASSRFVPDPAQRRALLLRAESDYEVVYAKQKPYFNKLSTHSRGELLFGLAETYARLDKPEKARPMLEAIVSGLKGTAYEKQAKTWLADTAAGPASTRSHTCIGCHVAAGER